MRICGVIVAQFPFFEYRNKIIYLYKDIIKTFDIILELPYKVEILSIKKMVHL